MNEVQNSVKNDAALEELCKRYIRQKYSVDDELGIARQKDKKPEKYETYYNYVEDCLARARKETYGE